MDAVVRWRMSAYNPFRTFGSLVLSGSYAAQSQALRYQLFIFEADKSAETFN
jgi:hypothetical protein